jgi:hypothetical protein
VEDLKIYMTKDEATTIIEKVQKTLSKIEKGYLSIAGDVAWLRDGQAWKKTGHKNLYELCAECFGMSRGTVSNMCQIYDRFGDGDYKLEKEAGGKKVTELLSIIKEEKAPEKKPEEIGEQAVEEKAKKGKRKRTVQTFEYTTIFPERLPDIIGDLTFDLRQGIFADEKVPEGYTIEVIIKR